LSTVRDDLAATRRALTELERCARSLRGHLGDSLDVRRVVGDAERLAASLAVLEEIVAGPRGPSPGQLEVIPDGEYDPSFWADAEDEGLGARDRRAP
jgi:hypothetical protein